MLKNKTNFDFNSFIQYGDKIKRFSHKLKIHPTPIIIIILVTSCSTNSKRIRTEKQDNVETAMVTKDIKRTLFAEDKILNSGRMTKVIG